MNFLNPKKATKDYMMIYNFQGPFGQMSNSEHNLALLRAPTLSQDLIYTFQERTDTLKIATEWTSLYKI